ncbi:hypothetical protein V6N13_130106 [Hibiscus sabdariffa]
MEGSMQACRNLCVLNVGWNSRNANTMGILPDPKMDENLPLSRHCVSTLSIFVTSLNGVCWIYQLSESLQDLHSYTGEGGYHKLLGSQLFNYGNWEAIRLHFPNLRWWLEDFKFVVFRFDGFTFMRYYHYDIDMTFAWNYSEVNYDVIKEQTIIDEDLYGLDYVKEIIWKFIVVRKFIGMPQGKIICLLGVGKTSIGRLIGSTLICRFPVGGLYDVVETNVHHWIYITVMLGKMVQGNKNVRTLDPLVLILNNQTEVEPVVIALLVKKTNMFLVENLIYVEGYRARILLWIGLELLWILPCGSKDSQDSVIGEWYSATFDSSFVDYMRKTLTTAISFGYARGVLSVANDLVIVYIALDFFKIYYDEELGHILENTFINFIFGLRKSIGK